MNLPDDSPTSEIAESTDHESTVIETASPVLWRPLTRMQRRVAGVLVEKSKTTPDIYPMSLNAIKTGCNQKSNRSPQMDFQEHQVENVLDELREMGAVIEVHTGGRVPKYKHQLYEWMDVEPVELAVIAELLLRGDQTIGELRGRAGRMDRIAGIHELKPILERLIEKNLIIELTPPGRGQTVSHHLYQPDELEQLRRQYGCDGSVATRVSDRPTREDEPDRAASPTSDTDKDRRVTELIEEVDKLRVAVADLRNEIAEIRELLN